MKRTTETEWEKRHNFAYLKPQSDRNSTNKNCWRAREEEGKQFAIGDYEKRKIDQSRAVDWILLPNKNIVQHNSLSVGIFLFASAARTFERFCRSLNTNWEPMFNFFTNQPAPFPTVKQEVSVAGFNLQPSYWTRETRELPYSLTGHSQFHVECNWV